MPRGAALIGVKNFRHQLGGLGVLSSSPPPRRGAAQILRDISRWCLGQGAPLIMGVVILSNISILATQSMKTMTLCVPFQGGSHL